MMKMMRRINTSWEVDSDGDAGPFFGAISYENELDDDRDNSVPMGGEGNVEVEYQSGNFILLLDNNIDATKKDKFMLSLLRLV